MSTGVTDVHEPSPVRTPSPPRDDATTLLVYLVLGVALGVIFIKSEVASWFRIQEMFRFRGFHMYGVIGSAVVVGGVPLALMRRARVRGRDGERILFPSAVETRPRPNHVLGGVLFGLGWGLVGACPGPLYALTGAGVPTLVVALLSAFAGAAVYGILRPRLPH